ncbi:MAG: NAD(+)/NADH kinase [Desulfobulbaceae bacterium]|nr:NAD(+)/NADH kinase [Desulfobulbaceae bacterium]
MTIRLVGIITKLDSPRVQKIGGELAKWFSRRGVQTKIDSIVPEMDMLVILGGDGTLLHVADQASRYDIPVTGINLGNLGFLTEVAESEMYQALQEILSGSGAIEKRMMLKARMVGDDDTEERESLFCLNEVAIVKGNKEKVIRLCSWSDEEYITTYKADGLIISTPTGSTAYNLSAGGPIVHAQLEAILVTPICPFMLASRPVLLSPRVRITTQLADSASDVKVMVDGRHTWDMREKNCLVVEAAEKPLQLYSSPNKGYFEILRNKLNWGGRESGFPLPEIASYCRE